MAYTPPILPFSTAAPNVVSLGSIGPTPHFLPSAMSAIITYTSPVYAPHSTFFPTTMTNLILAYPFECVHPTRHPILIPTTPVHERLPKNRPSWSYFSATSYLPPWRHVASPTSAPSLSVGDNYSLSARRAIHHFHLETAGCFFMYGMTVFNHVERSNSISGRILKWEPGQWKMHHSPILLLIEYMPPKWPFPDVFNQLVKKATRTVYLRLYYITSLPFDTNLQIDWMSPSVFVLLGGTFHLRS